MLAELVTAFAAAVGPPAAADAAPLRVEPPPVGARYGEIVIPALGERETIVQGTAPAQLARGVGHLVQTYLPGMGGNVSLFGHRVTPTKGRPYGPFRYINRLRRGDRIVAKMPYGRYVYRVTGRRIITPREWRLFKPRLGREVLTVAACHPAGSAAYRLVVVATPERR